MDLTPSTIITQTSDTNTQTPPPPPPPPPTTTTTTTQLPNNNNNSTSNPKSSSFTNGSLKRHNPNTTAVAGSLPKQPPSPMGVSSYKECLKNHAATLGGYALDGCGEFMPSSSSNPAEPRSLTCAACGCHRNFHRRDHRTQHQDQYHHHPNFLSFYHSPPQRQPPSSLGPHRGLSISTSPSLSPSPSASPISSPSPPPISHHFPPYNNNSRYSAPPNMLLALGNNDTCNSDHDYHHRNHGGFNSSSVVITKIEKNHVQKKRYRSKFSQEQKEKMLRFSEKLGWRMQKGEETLVQEFCNEVGVPREVFKVWMHNNKNNFRKRSLETMVNNNKNNNAANTVVDEKNVNDGDRNGNGIDNPCDNDIHRD